MMKWLLFRHLTRIVDLMTLGFSVKAHLVSSTQFMIKDVAC